MAPERPGFRPDIEGLRGIAILLVIAFHAGVGAFAGAFVGVDVFFVLSGYLITGLLSREVLATGDLDVAEFYARRARRLLPAFLVVVLATLAIALLLYAPIDVPRIAGDGRAVALHYGNVLFAQQAVNYHAASGNPFLHTWSLAVEEQFYLLWPFLFLLVARAQLPETRARKRMLIAVLAASTASFVAAIVVTGNAQPWAFFGMPTRIWEFGIGALLALRAGRVPAWLSSRGTLLQTAGLLAIGIAVAVYHEALPYPGGLALLPVLGAAALVLGGELAPNGVVSRALGNSALQFFGKVSYAWYLWHWPLVGLGVVLDWRIGAAGKLAWSLVALGLAMLTRRFIEEPVRRGERLDFDARRTNIGGLLASVAVALMAWLALGFADRRVSSPLQRRIAAARVDGMEHHCWGSYTTNATAPCVFGDTSASTDVVLIGDSHAEHWLPAMDRIGRERRWKVHAMVKPGCPAADVPELLSRGLRRVYRECAEWRREQMRAILALRPSFVVLSSYDHYVANPSDPSPWNVSAAAWQAGLRRIYAELASAGIAVIAMRDVPDIGFNAPGCLSRRAAELPFASECRYDLRESLHPAAIAAQTAAARGLPNVAFVDMNDRVCATRPCSVVVRGTIVYRDDDHLTASFSYEQAPELGRRIVAALGSPGNFGEGERGRCNAATASPGLASAKPSETVQGFCGRAIQGFGGFEDRAPLRESPAGRTRDKSTWCLLRVRRELPPRTRDPDPQISKIAKSFL